MAKKPNISDISETALGVLHKIYRYRYLILVIFVAALYGYVYVRINALDQAQPTSSQIATQSKLLPSATIDKGAAQQLESLQNNNVSVQALFEQARSNPFQE